MTFDSLNPNQKAVIWNRLYELVTQKEKIEDCLSSLRKEQKNIKEKLESTSCWGGLILIFLIFSGGPAIVSIVYGIVTSDEKILGFIEDVWAYREYVFLVLLFIAIVLLIYLIIRFTKRNKIKNQLSQRAKQISRFEEEKATIDLEIDATCDKYNIPKKVITKKCILYVKELVENRKYDYCAAFSYCIKNWEEVNRPSLAETAAMYPRKPRNTQDGKSLEDRFFALPFKFAGAMMGIDPEAIRRQAHYGDSDSHASSEDSAFHVDPLQDHTPSIDSVRSAYIEAYTLSKETGGPMVLNLDTAGLSKDEVSQAIIEAKSYLDSIGYK